MINQKINNSKSRIKAWAVKKVRSNRIMDDKFYRYHFEMPEGSYPQREQKALVICPTEFWAKKWKNKWVNNKDFEIVSCEIILKRLTKKRE